MGGMYHWRWLSVALLGSAVLLAQAEEGGEAEPAVSAWSGDMELAYLLKRGNSESDTFQGKVNAERDGHRWRHTFKGEGANTETRNDLGENERSQERYFASYKLDRKLGKDSPNYLFNFLSYEKDLFSGFHYRAAYSLGIGRRWLDNDAHRLDTEVGPGYRVDCLEPQSGYFSCDNSDETALARVALKYRWQISENASFTEEVSSDISGDITSTRAQTSLTSKINGNFSMRLSHLLIHNTEVPAGTKKADHEVTASLVYSF